MKISSIAVTVLLATSIVGCNNSTSPTEPASPGMASIVVTTLEESSTTPVPEALVEVRATRTGPVIVSGRTSSTGVITFSVVPDIYWVTAIPPTGYTVTQPAPVINQMVQLAPDRTFNLTWQFVKQ